MCQSLSLLEALSAAQLPGKEQLACPSLLHIAQAPLPEGTPTNIARPWMEGGFPRKKSYTCMVAGLLNR